MQNSERLTRQQISDFLKASEEINFSGQSRAEVYGWVQRVLVAQEFGGQRKKDRGRTRVIHETSSVTVPST